MIERKLRYRFKDPALLATALAHGSYANEFSCESNERLEFLGDAVLGCAVSRILHDRFPSPSEGDLSKIGARGPQAEPACAGTPGRPAPTGAQGSGRGEEGSGGREKDSIPAALLGAAYLDAGCPEGFRDGGRAGRLRARKRRFLPRRRDETAGKRRGARKTASGSFHPRRGFSPRRIGGATFSFYSRTWNTPTFPLPLRA